ATRFCGDSGRVTSPERHTPSSRARGQGAGRYYFGSGHQARFGYSASDEEEGDEPGRPLFSPGAFPGARDHDERRRPGDPSLSAQDAASVMVAERFGALPVVREGELIGIGTETDLLRYFANSGPVKVTTNRKPMKRPRLATRRH